MGKNEKGSAKEVANRTKSRGLQKLKWYCEMCQKQCRDANGYKCHLSSEAHQRQLLLVAENPDSYVRAFSRQFEEAFMFVLKNSYGYRRVRANEVYQEYIKDKDHVHMNSTRWSSLTGFVQFLASTGKCNIDKNEEKGWYVQLIDKEASVKREEEERRVKQEKDDEDRQLQMINERVQRALEQQGDVEEYQPTDLIRNDDEKIQLNLMINRKPTAEDLNKPYLNASTSVFDAKKPSIKKEEPEDESDSHKRGHKRERSRSRERTSKSSSKSKESKRSALDDIREMNERIKEKNNRKDFWLHEGIIVKIVTKKLGPDFYKAKGFVKQMVDDYTANVKLNDGTVVKVDQSHVETVIPSVGREMLVVNGGYRGNKATLDSLDEKNFQLNLTISSGLLKGRSIKVAYEDASKLM